MTHASSATDFFRRHAAASPNFEHEEIDTGGTKRPTKIHLHALDPDTGDRMGTLTYHVPRRKADKILIEHLGTDDAHRRKGVGSALMDEMQRRHPGTPIDHGDRTDAGKAWWSGYTDGKKVTRGRTMAALTATATMRDGDDIPSGWLNPHGRQIRVRTVGQNNVELVPRHEVERYASQETTKEHTKEVGEHIINSGEMEPLILHYHPKSGEAYLGEGNHRLRAARALQMDHVPLRVNRNNYSLPGPGVKVPQDHPAHTAGKHVPYDIKPSDIGLGLGQHRTAAADTPVPDNHDPYQHEHPWLPRDHFFAPGKKDLDPRLFDGDRMLPEVRQHLLSLLHGFWAPRYGDSWQTWARVYLAGSEASHFYGNDDLDILIGVDHEALNQHVDTFAGEPYGEVDERLTDELRHGLNDDTRMLPGPDGQETGPWENTWYVNPDSYDIRDIKPYAAYDITRDEWAVRPVEVPADFGPEKLPESTWDVFEALQTLIKAVAELPDGVREREGAALYDYLHGDRHAAFGPEGSGLYDPANATWKALDKAPGKPLQQLIDWKHAHGGASAVTEQEKAV
ncbi:GNAT family N-acetyltransferase [Streptomyces sp. NPDC088752]|uniref:GNAT family N-acetyltransferase n=1 Tax=Streptomyces sp. NPDC088752 TaxID=3154963 RepID=UPI00342E3C9F